MCKEFMFENMVYINDTYITFNIIDLNRSAGTVTVNVTETGHHTVDTFELYDLDGWTYFERGCITMKFGDLTKLIEKQGADLFKANLQHVIQPIASKIEEHVEFLEAKGYDDNTDIMLIVIEEAARLVRKLRKHGG